MSVTAKDFVEFDDAINRMAASLKDAGWSNGAIVEVIRVMTDGYVLCSRCLHTSWHPKVSVGDWTDICRWCVLALEDGEE